MHKYNMNPPTKQIIQNQFKISEGDKWNSHQMPCVYSSPMVKNYRICPIRIEIIHGRHRVVQIYTKHIYCVFSNIDSIEQFLRKNIKKSRSSFVHHFVR
jgi:hypothetical protein